VFYYSNGEIFVGDWLNDKKHGLGILMGKYGGSKRQVFIENL